MSEMIERVAKAIWDRSKTSVWRNLSEEWKSEFRAEARAAIEAMREPTSEMVGAAYSRDHAPFNPGYMHETWRAMIDAALATGEKTINRRRQ